MNPNNPTTVVVDDISPNIALDEEEDFFNPKNRYSARERRRFMRYREVRDHQGTPPKNATDKFIDKLGTLTMRQLVRRLKQAARLASHFKHTAAKAGPYLQPKLRALHDHALMSFTRVQTEIEFRTTPKES
jgi:hypothetical protein